MSRVPSTPNRLRELRLARGLTQMQLAEMVDCSHAQIQRMEGGTRRLGDRWVRPLAAALGVHPGEIYEPLPDTAQKPSAADVREAIQTLKKAMAS